MDDFMKQKYGFLLRNRLFSSDYEKFCTVKERKVLRHNI